MARGTNGPTDVLAMEPRDEVQTAKYYRRLRLFLALGLMGAYLAPLSVMSVYFHLQFNRTLKQSGKQHLTALAESQSNTVDLFLQERVLNILNVLHRSLSGPAVTAEDMQRYLQQLQDASDAFVDVGVFDPKGIQVGYAGPYPFLQGRDYSGERWFQTLMTQPAYSYISDVYLGFRKHPHFTIAVKQTYQGQPLIMRATLDPDKFYQFLQSRSQGPAVDSAIVNQEGVYQVVSPSRGRVSERCGFISPQRLGTGATELVINGDTVLVAHAALTEAPWTLLVLQPLRVAYADVYRARRVFIGSTTILAVLTIAMIWIATSRIVGQLQASAETKAQLRSQLLHAAKLAAVGELAAGVAHEINNPLAIIGSESGVIRDMLDPQFGLQATAEEIREELDRIDEAVFRGRSITQKLLSLARKAEPTLQPCNLNEIVQEVALGLKERQFAVSNIELVWDLDPQLPELLLDPDQIRQVFLNILNNAGDAIQDGGTITVSSRANADCVRVSIADTGRGMTPEEQEKIFLPFYTTKEVGKGTGLGLAISHSIVASLGGRIEVQSMKGAGSIFSVVFPSNLRRRPGSPRADMG